MNLYLDAPTLSDCEVVREWRNTEAVRATLRTPHMLTAEQQAAFYRDVVCNRLARSRWWTVCASGDRVPVAFAGLTDIQWEAGTAEISLVVDPHQHGKGHGATAVELVLREAFDRMRLLCVRAEVYEHNPALGFWENMARRYGEPGDVRLPYRKFWDGVPRDGVFFHFTARAWRALHA